MTADGLHVHQSVTDELVALDERMTADETEIGLISGRLSKLEAPVSVPPPVIVPPATGLVVGPGVFFATKGNQQVGGTDRRRVAHLFVVDRSGMIVGIRQSFRGGSGGYSGGNGGTIKLSIQAVTGVTPSGQPIGTSVAHVPGNSGVWTTYPELLLSVPVVAGQLLAAVYEDIDPAQDMNFCSTNEGFCWNPPRQPRWADGTWATVVSVNGGPWVVDANHTPVMDLRYADGHHQGDGYVGMIGGTFTGSPNPAQNPLTLPISGVNKVRSTWTNLGPVTIGELGTYVRHDHGGDALFITVRRADGSSPFEVQVPASSVPLSTTSGLDKAGMAWAKGTAPAAVIQAGQYEVRLSAAAASLYTAAPIRDGVDVGFDPSIAWPFGSFQYSSDDGKTWKDVYPGLDLMWYGR